MEENFIRHETIIDKEDVKKLWEMHHDSKYEDAQEYEVSEFLDGLIDWFIQGQIHHIAILS